MWSNLVHSFPNALDLLALTTCIGTLACRLWAVPATPVESSVIQPLLARLWRLLLVCLTVLVLSSAIELIQRAAEMSGRPLGEVFSILHAVLFNSHYGQAWLVRVIALVMLWVGWLLGRRKLDSRTVPIFMLISAVLIALTRSASGHGADAGDMSLPELMDWFHLLAASLWSGSLVAFTTVIFPTWFRYGGQHAQLIAHMARRFSALAGIALAAILLTGLYNTWFEVRTLSALWTTSYGNILSIKLLLVLALIILGASNRYISVPLLERRAGYPQTGNGLFKWFTLRYLSHPQGNMDETSVARHFAHKVMTEVILMVSVLVCAALLIHETPARHQPHTGHMTLQPHFGHGTH
ncbi:MAG TPA: CopD family protein [Burkholderiales bacterium]|nr:CopD family protein [Burkholderiales bacterium]